MLRPTLAIVLALAMSCAAVAQQPSISLPRPLATALIGLPVYSSDAQEVGQVTAIDLSSDGRITGVQAEISGFLGLGSSSVHFGTDEFEQKGDRIVLSKSANQVRSAPGGTYQKFDRTQKAAGSMGSP